MTLALAAAVAAAPGHPRLAHAESADCLAQNGLDHPVGDTLEACLKDPIQDKLGTAVLGSKAYEDLKKVKDWFDVVDHGYTAASAASEENWAEAIEGLVGVAGVYLPGLECMSAITNNGVFKPVAALGCLSQQLAATYCHQGQNPCLNNQKLFCDYTGFCDCYSEADPPPFVPNTPAASQWADCGWGSYCNNDNDCRNSDQVCTADGVCARPDSCDESAGGPSAGCNGGCDGNGSTYDRCGVCGGNGMSCVGCDGVVNSGKTTDACGVCGGNGTSCMGCDGVANSGLVYDACGVCGGNDSSCAGCDGIPWSGASYDACGVCGGDDSSCMGCDGVPWSGAVYDACGVCGGNDSSCAGCDGIPWSGASYDACGVCGGDGSSCSGGDDGGGDGGGGGGGGSLCDEIYGDWTWDECYMDDGCWDTCVEAED